MSTFFCSRLVELCCTQQCVHSSPRICCPEASAWHSVRLTFSLCCQKSLMVCSSSDDTLYSHYSTISTVEGNWGLNNLGRGDVNATMGNVFEYVHPSPHLLSTVLGLTTKLPTYPPSLLVTPLIVSSPKKSTSRTPIHHKQPNPPRTNIISSQALYILLNGYHSLRLSILLGLVVRRS